MLTIEDLFQQAGFAPNQNQRQAILHGDTPLFLVAGPGSGKTRVLLWRTLNLIVFRDVLPSEIFLGTFTEKAAAQLRGGLLSLLGLVTNRTGRTFDLSSMYLGTIHSLCHRILQDRAFSPGRSRSEVPVVHDELGQYFQVAAASFWRAALTHLGFGGDVEALRQQINGLFEPNPSPSKHKAVTHLVAFFNRLSEEDLRPEDILQRTDATTRPLVSLYQLYLDRLGPKFTDLSLLQQVAYRLLGPQPAARFKHLIIDEHQDTNAIQERLFFRLAQGARSLCVVGDDDQALYRFRGATVENFVQFAQRCEKNLGTSPTRIALNTNYRSRRQIVSFYTKFIEQTNWAREVGGGAYRIHDKNIHAHSLDDAPAVVAATPAPPEDVATEIAELVRRLLDQGRVADPSQIAFLFPSLKSVAVERMQHALEAQGLRVYAPRARRFLEADEPTALFGLLGQVLGRPPRVAEFDRGGYREFHDWLDRCATTATGLCKGDPRLAAFVRERADELRLIQRDHASLSKTIAEKKWDLQAAYDPALHKRALLASAGLSERGKRGLGTSYLDRIANERQRQGNPFTLRYIVSRATSVDWGFLDLFYRLCGFDHFKEMFDLAERQKDEGPVCNLSLTSQYLARYGDLFPSVITASALAEGLLGRLFYHAFLFALFRLGEGEFEDADDPFPRGRIPFLTIHQSKGLEFPVVVLAGLHPINRSPRPIEVMVRPFLPQDGEPLQRMGEFDAMRTFYVALSRAQNLLILAHPKGRGQQIDPAFKGILAGPITRIPNLKVDQVPIASPRRSDITHAYSYTGDYLAYLRCPRQYMLFRKYGFAASRTQTMFFGSLVHQTIEDLHNHLISQRAPGAGGA